MYYKEEKIRSEMKICEEKERMIESNSFKYNVYRYNIPCVKKPMKGFNFFPLFSLFSSCQEVQKGEKNWINRLNILWSKNSNASAKRWKRSNGFRSCMTEKIMANNGLYTKKISTEAEHIIVYLERIKQIFVVENVQKIKWNQIQYSIRQHINFSWK